MADKKTELRNILLHIIEGGFFMGAMVFLDQYTIMIGFIRRLTLNPFIISLIPAALVIGFNVPGLFTAQLIQRIQNKHRFVIITGLFQRLMILLLAIFTLTLNRFSGPTAGILSALIFFLFAGIGGTGGPAWLDLLLRTVPAGKRARVIAMRNAIGAITGTVFPIVIAYILKNHAFPGNYRILFLISFVFFAISLGGFVLIRDIDAPPVSETSQHRFGPFLKKLPKEDPNFISFLVSRVLFSFCFITSSFFTVYYLTRNRIADDSVVAAFALALNISKIAGGLTLGHIADKKGSLLIYKFGIFLFVPANILILLSPSFPVLICVFILFGLIVAVDTNTYQVFIGEFGNTSNRVYYATMASSVAGIFSGLLPVAAGALLQAGYISFSALFAFCACIAAVCFVFVHRRVRSPGAGQKLKKRPPVLHRRSTNCL